MVQSQTALTDDADRLPASVPATIEGSRLGVYAALGASVSAVPLPWIPDAMIRHVRGALVHDIAIRHGLSLTREARAALAEPSGPDGPRGVFSQALRFLGVRLAVRMLTRIGPIGLVWPVQNAVRTFVLGRMFDRYLERTRHERLRPRLGGAAEMPSRAVRVDVDEARRIRSAIDGALARAVSVEAPPPAEEPTAIDDQRDPTTVLVDSLLGVAAGVPERLLRRLDVAFDELLAQADG
jgi:hypothetical protein